MSAAGQRSAEGFISVGMAADCPATTRAYMTGPIKPNYRDRFAYAFDTRTSPHRRSTFMLAFKLSKFDFSLLLRVKENYCSFLTGLPFSRCLSPRPPRGPYALPICAPSRNASTYGGCYFDYGQMTLRMHNCAGWATIAIALSTRFLFSTTELSCTALSTVTTEVA